MTDASEKIPLHDAARKNKVDELHTLLAGRADIEVTESTFGWTALHIAAGSGAREALQALLEARASIEARARDGETALHTAAGEGQTKIIKLLAEFGGDVQAANDDGETPLHAAVQSADDKPNLQHVRALLELRADPSARDAGGHSVFESTGLYSKDLDRAQEVRDILSGAPPREADPDDPWPDVPGDLETGTEPIQVAEALREVGNKAFKEQRFEDAVKYYLKAKRFLPTGPAQYEPVAEGDAEGARARACALAVGSNAALCKLKLGDHEACVSMCDGILMVDRGSVKAYYRKALALRAQHREAEAEAALQQASAVDPQDAAVRKELADIAKQRKSEKDKEKRMAQKMFG